MTREGWEREVMASAPTKTRRRREKLTVMITCGNQYEIWTNRHALDKK